MRRSARLTLALVLTALAAATAVVPAQAGDPKGFEVDLAIRGGVKSNYVGVGIINDTGNDQVKSRIAQRAEIDRFRVRFTNTGGSSDIYGFTGAGNDKGFVVRYEADGQDITNEMTINGYYPPDVLDPGDSATFRVFITAPKNAKEGSSIVVPITGFSKGGGLDVVKAKVTVKVGAGDQNSQAPA